MRMQKKLPTTAPKKIHQRSLRGIISPRLLLLLLSLFSCCDVLHQTNVTASAALRFQSSAAAVAAAESSKEGRDAYKVSRTVVGTDACLKVGLDKLGITNPSTLYRNLSYPELFEHEQANNEGVVANAEYGPTFAVDTGKYTGRSPKDRWLVMNPGSETAENIDWNNINQV